MCFWHKFLLLKIFYTVQKSLSLQRHVCMWSKGWKWHPSFYAMFRPFLALNAFRGKQHNPQFDPPIYFIILFWCILRNYLRLNSPPVVYSFIEDIFFLSWSDWRYKSSHKTTMITFFFTVSYTIGVTKYILIIELIKQGQKKVWLWSIHFCLIYCLIFTE